MAKDLNKNVLEELNKKVDVLLKNLLNKKVLLTDTLKGKEIGRKTKPSILRK
tara:strand:+ start:1556 stop:1711 length:156 start_codon:yes stop_codon:yes gene_type:complete